MKIQLIIFSSPYLSPSVLQVVTQRTSLESCLMKPTVSTCVWITYKREWTCLLSKSPSWTPQWKRVTSRAKLNLCIISRSYQAFSCSGWQLERGWERARSPLRVLSSIMVFFQPVVREMTQLSLPWKRETSNCITLLLPLLLSSLSFVLLSAE